MELKDKKSAFVLNLKNSNLLFFLAILALGTFLRLYKLDFKSLWIDELYSIVPVNPDNTNEFIVEHCKADQPPFFFLLLHYWFKLTSYTPYFGRLLSAVCGILGIVAMYFLGREIRNEVTGLMASLLTAVNYYHIYYSQELRFYSLLFLLAVVSFLYFMRSLKRKDIGSYALYTVSTIALLYTQYFGMLVFAIQGFIFILYIIFYREKIRFILTGLFLAILIGASFIPWLPTLLYDSEITSYWIPAPEPYFFVVYYYLYWGKDIFTGILLLGVACLYLWFVYRSIKEKTLSRDELFVVIILVSWILLSYSIPYIRSLVSTPMLIPRYTLITLPAIIVVIALGFDRIMKGFIRKGIVGLVVLSSVINLMFIQKHYSKVDKAQWREAAQTVIDNHEPNVKVYSNLEWWYNFYFYRTDPYIKVLGKYSSNEEAELEPFIAEMGSEEKFWVLHGEGVPGLNNSQQKFVDEHFVVEKRWDFFAASAILYTAK